MSKWPYAKGLHDLGNSVYAYLQPDGTWGWSNAGIVVDGEASLLIDTLFDLKLTRVMLDTMCKSIPAAAHINMVVNTHANGDHCWGNEMVADAQIIASARTAEEMTTAISPTMVATLLKRAPELGHLGEFLSHAFGLRALVLIPFIVPTVLSALAFWWIFDSQFSIISWSLKHLGIITQNINFLGDPTWARICVIFANIWRGVPFVAITLLAGLQTVQPSLYEAATLDGASKWEMFRFITYPLLTPIIAVVMTFSVLFTFTDFQLIWAMTRGGPVNATHLMATLSYQRAIIAGQLGEGAAISSAMIPFLLAAIMVSWFGLQRRKWQQGESND
ncbi:MAG TPA: ABC transporter permease subunit [Ktedonobacteraceae bacterium]